MAVVKANYVKSGAGEKGRAKATIRYIADRPGKDKEKTARELFGPDGKLTKEQARRMIDEAAKGTLFYRLIISPDPRREDSHKDLNLSELTIQTIAELEDRLKTSIQFAAVVHDDHAPHRHIHVLALLSKKLSRADINFLSQSNSRQPASKAHPRPQAGEVACRRTQAGKTNTAPQQGSETDQHEEQPVRPSSFENPAVLSQLQRGLQHAHAQDRPGPA